MYKFNSKKYITNGIKDSIPFIVQLSLWEAIDKLKETNVKLDYLQIFNLTTIFIDNKKVLKIEHMQEQPPYSQVYLLKNIEESINVKIFVIDSIDYITMLLSNEY